MRRAADLLVVYEGAGCLRRLRPHRMKMKGLGKHTRTPLDGQPSLSFAAARWCRDKPPGSAGSRMEVGIDLRHRLLGRPAGRSPRQPLPTGRPCGLARSKPSTGDENHLLRMHRVRRPEEVVRQEHSFSTPPLLSRRLGGPGRTPVSVRRRRYRGEPPDRFQTQADQKPEVGSHGGLVQGCVAKAPTRGARTQTSEVAA